MTSATVDTNQGSGQYGITLVYDTVVLDGQIAALEQQLIDGVQPLLDAQIALSDARAERETLADALDAAITAYQAGDTDAAPVIDATRALAEQAAAVTIAELTVQRLTGQKLSLSARLTFLQNLIVAQQAATTFVWCADYSTDIDPGTTVPVAITPGEIGPGGEPFVILPRQHPDGYGATYSRAEFGQLVPRMSMAPVVTFANWGLLPGWQRWMPTFRIGEIESLDTGANTCDLLLESARSSAGPYPYSAGLNVNLAESTDTRLEGVPVRYMVCDAAAFQVGDRVLVRFKNVDPATPDSNWGNPEVVGFVTDPRLCPGIEDIDFDDPVEWVQIRVFDRDDLSFTYYKVRRNDADTGWVIEDNDVPIQHPGVWRDSTAEHLYTYGTPTGTTNPEFTYYYNGNERSAPHRCSIVARQSAGYVVTVGYRWTSLPSGGNLEIYAGRSGIGQIPINGSTPYTYTGAVEEINAVHPRIISTANADGTQFCLDSPGLSEYILITVAEGATTASLSQSAKSHSSGCEDNTTCENPLSPDNTEYTYSPDITTFVNQEVRYFPRNSNTLESLTYSRTMTLSGTVTEDSGSTTEENTTDYSSSWTSYSFSSSTTRFSFVNGTSETAVTGNRANFASLALAPDRLVEVVTVAVADGDSFIRTLLNGSTANEIVIAGAGPQSGTGDNSYPQSFSCSLSVDSCDTSELGFTPMDGAGLQQLITGDWWYTTVINHLSDESPNGRFQIAVTSDGPLDLDAFLPTGWEQGRHEVATIGVFRGAK